MCTSPCCSGNCILSSGLTTNSLKQELVHTLTTINLWSVHIPLLFRQLHSIFRFNHFLKPRACSHSHYNKPVDHGVCIFPCYSGNCILSSRLTPPPPPKLVHTLTAINLWSVFPSKHCFIFPLQARSAQYFIHKPTSPADYADHLWVQKGDCESLPNMPVKTNLHKPNKKSTVHLRVSYWVVTRATPQGLLPKHRKRINHVTQINWDGGGGGATAFCLQV